MWSPALSECDTQAGCRQRCRRSWLPWDRVRSTGCCGVVPRGCRVRAFTCVVDCSPPRVCMNQVQYAYCDTHDRHGGVQARNELKPGKLRTSSADDRASVCFDSPQVSPCAWSTGDKLSAGYCTKAAVQCTRSHVNRRAPKLLGQVNLEHAQTVDPRTSCRHSRCHGDGTATQDAPTRSPSILPSPSAVTCMRSDATGAAHGRVRGSYARATRARAKIC